MQVGVIKLGSRISFNASDTSGGNGEARSVIAILEKAGIKVHIYTKILSKDTLLPQYQWHDIESDYATDNLDALIVLNGNVNFFGGAEDRPQILNYHIINNFKGQVFYVYCDPELTFKQLWPAVEKKPWGGNYLEKDVHVSRNDIVYISQPHDVDKIAASFGKNEIKPSNIVHFPFEQFPCLHPRFSPYADPDVDLSYGGTMRGGKRILKMAKFYFGLPDDIKVEMFGKITAEDFTLKAFSKGEMKQLGMSEFTTEELKATLGRFPDFSGPVRYGVMHQKMNTALAHVVIGDPYYEQINDMAQRCYESIWSASITFIDSDLDQLRRVYGADKELCDFLYVSTKQQVVDRIREIKNDGHLRIEILRAQWAAVGFDAADYSARLKEILSRKF